ncbi:hypothetical protein B0H14DRAFT_3481457 [Mycena olivaceomarginata]|nr:hypothetical protein B0H14DRAFT_3481457 [Mycena olivaceomarginata]
MTERKKCQDQVPTTAIPHAFQQILSAEKTPTLGYALPAFEAMASKWEQLKNDRPELEHHPKGS